MWTVKSICNIFWRLKLKTEEEEEEEENDDNDHDDNDHDDDDDDDDSWVSKGTSTQLQVILCDWLLTWELLL